MVTKKWLKMNSLLMAELLRMKTWILKAGNLYLQSPMRWSKMWVMWTFYGENSTFQEGMAANNSSTMPLCLNFKLLLTRNFNWSTHSVKKLWLGCLIVDFQGCGIPFSIIHVLVKNAILSIKWSNGLYSFSSTVYTNMTLILRVCI